MIDPTITTPYLRRRINSLLPILPLNYDCIELIVKEEIKLLDNFIAENIDEENLSKIGVMLIYYNEYFDVQLNFYDFDLDYFVNTEYLKLIGGFVLNTEGEKILIDNDEYIIIEENEAEERAKISLTDYYETEIEEAELSSIIKDFIDIDGLVERVLAIDGISHTLGYNEIDYIEANNKYYYIFKE